MNKIVLTKQEMQDILDKEEYIEGDFEKHYRHNGGDQEIIFKKDDKHYITSYRWFEDDGIVWNNEYTAVEVVEAERVEKYWKVVE